MQTKEKIVQYIKNKGQATGSELSDYLGITDRAVRKQLSSLLEKNILNKIGRPPKVFYLLKEIDQQENILIDEKELQFINKNYLMITPTGVRKDGFDGFVFWCNRNNLDIKKTAKEYIQTAKKYNKYKKNGFINGLNKMKETFKDVYLDQLYYLDFYSIERFGKTKLGQMLLYAKQSQNKNLMKELILDLKPRVEQLMKKYKIDGVGFIPPTVKRETQFMKELEKNLHLGARTISIIKIKTEVAVPQKTLNKLSDRIENAQKTIVVNEKDEYKNILLLDDAIGSGATLNETAAQIKAKGIVKGKIIGLAITGSFKGFDVISEV